MRRSICSKTFDVWQKCTMMLIFDVRYGMPQALKLSPVADVNSLQITSNAPGFGL